MNLIQRFEGLRIEFLNQKNNSVALVSGVSANYCICQFNVKLHPNLY